MIQLGADFTSALPEILYRFCQRAVACFKGTCHRLRGAEGVYIGGVFAGAANDNDDQILRALHHRHQGIEWRGGKAVGDLDAQTALDVFLGKLAERQLAVRLQK